MESTRRVHRQYRTQQSRPRLALQHTTPSHRPQQHLRPHQRLRHTPLRRLQRLVRDWSLSRRPHREKQDNQRPHQQLPVHQRHHLHLSRDTQSRQAEEILPQRHHHTSQPHTDLRQAHTLRQVRRRNQVRRQYHHLQHRLRSLPLEPTHLPFRAGHQPRHTQQQV